MSLISRLFRKAPPAAVSTQTPAVPAAVPAAAPSAAVAAESAAKAAALAALAAQEEQSLATALAAADAAAIGEFVVAGSTTAVRQRAAQAVLDPAQVRELLRRVRGGNDKQVYRILSAKREAHLTQQRESERLQAETDAAAEAIERHSHRPFEPLYEPMLEQLEKRWQPLAGSAAPALQERVGQALERARAVIRLHNQAVESERAAALAATLAAEQAAQQRAFEAEAAAAAAAEHARLQEQEHRVQLEKQQADAQALGALAALLRKAQAALAEGNTARAARLLGQFTELAAGAPPLPAWMMRQREQLDAKLNELKDWNAYSAVPKRDELIAEIEALAAATLTPGTLDPVALDQRIRDLRRQWRTLGKGAGENLTVDWEQRFSAAAERAYEPCREYFAAQAEQRRINLERRAALVERLAAFAAAQAEPGADWRLISQVLREARQEWRRHAPVDRLAVAPLRQRFTAEWTALQGRLEAEYARNVASRRALIERAAALLLEPDVRQAVEELKGLQQRWREAGPVPRDQEQPSWDAFRQHCDAVFQRRDQESAAYATSLETNRSQAAALCAELERVAALQGAELLASASRVDELRDAVAALDLPREGARELQRRADRAVQRCRSALAAQQARDAQQVWVDLLQVASLVRAFGLAVATRADPLDRDRRRAQAEAAMGALRAWPPGSRAVVDRQFGNAAAGTVPPDLAANEAALRELCVRAEILANAPTPAEDQAMRQAQQLQRLVQSMGQGMQADAGQRQALMLEWLKVGPVTAAAEALLQERFQRGWMALAGPDCG